MGSKQSGFSLIEVLVSFTILLIVLVGVFELRLNSIRRTEDTGTRNQIQDLIRIDMALVRKKALKWQCQPGASCSGSDDAQYRPARYLNSHCSKSKPEQFNQFLVDEKISKNSTTYDGEMIKIFRVIEITDNQLNVTYSGTAGEKTISTNITISPQAMRWCS